MLFKQPQRKQFDYTPLYYKPEQDPDARRRARLRIPRMTKSAGMVSRTVWIFFLGLLILISYLLKKLETYF